MAQQLQFEVDAFPLSHCCLTLMDTCSETSRCLGGNRYLCLWVDGSPDIPHFLLLNPLTQDPAKMDKTVSPTCLAQWSMLHGNLGDPSESDTISSVSSKTTNETEVWEGDIVGQRLIAHMWGSEIICLEPMGKSRCGVHICNSSAEEAGARRSLPGQPIPVVLSLWV